MPAILIVLGARDWGGIDTMTIAIYGVAAALGGACIFLMLLAGRRFLARRGGVVETMLRRSDDRLAEFAQTLNDALSQPLPARIIAAISEPEGLHAAAPIKHGEGMRLLEVARASTASDAAVAFVAEPNREPILATVGLSDSEAAQVGRL